MKTKLHTNNKSEHPPSQKYPKAGVPSEKSKILDSTKKILDTFSTALQGMIPGLQSTSEGVYTMLIRWILPVLAVVILIRCILPLLGGRKRSTAWGYLVMPTGERLPLMHWENSIGRSRLSDIVINLAFISRSHAVLSYSDGGWTVADLGTKGGVSVNGEKIEGPEPVSPGDTLSLAGLDLTLQDADEPLINEAPRGIQRNIERAGRRMSSGATLFLIVIFQILGALQLCFSSAAVAGGAPAVFFVFLLMECVLYFISRMFGEKYFEMELLACFLCGIGLFVVASATPRSLFKQLAAILVGVAAYYTLLFLIRNLSRAQKLRYILMASAVLLLVLNIVLGETRNGARNWIDLGFMTFQPMEFVKIAFVLAGTATLDRLLTTRNLTSFLIFSGACIGTLAITKDFGTALIFFSAFLVIAFMRSGDVRTIALISAGALLGAVAVISFMPYVTRRFSVYRHAWSFPDTTGYQQTRTMIAAASGGLLGVGGGKGYLVKVAASNTDLVFGVISEEWGLIIALIAVGIILFFALFAVSSVGKCRSSFYAIAACGAATIFLMQTALNVFGSVDFLPLTGVTFPFISNGGSSMVTCWCLLAFIKSADERFRPRRLRLKQHRSAAAGKGFSE